MSFDELQQRINDLDSLFKKESSLAPLMEVGDIDINLQQINTCVAEMLRAGTQDHVKFLLCRTIDSAILSMKKYADSEQHQSYVTLLLQSKEFIALQNARPFLIQQQQQWYPLYLLQELRDVFSKFETNVNLRVKIEEIAKDNSDWKTKTEQIDRAIAIFSQSNVISFFGDKTKPLKVALKEKMEAERSTITRLTTSQPALVINVSRAP